jgi:hypothetical protein
MELSRITEALREGEEYREVLAWAEEKGETDLFSAFLSYHDFDPDSESASPFLLAKEILTERGELSQEEIVLLLCRMSETFFNEMFP